MNPNYEKDFVLYTHGGESSIVAILMQQNNQGMEQPLAFFSQTLKYYEVRYNPMDKQVFSILRALKKFRYMLENNHIKVLVSHPSVRDYIMGIEISEKRASWSLRS